MPDKPSKKRKGLEELIGRADKARQEADHIIQSDASEVKDIEAAIELLTKSSSLYEKAGDIRGIALSLWSQGQAFLTLGQRPEAIDAFRQCSEIEEAEGLADESRKSAELVKRLSDIEPGSADDILLGTHGRALKEAHNTMQRGLTALRTGQEDKAIDLLEEAVIQHDKVPFWQGSVASRASLAQALALTGNGRRCGAVIREARKIAEDNGDRDELGRLNKLHQRLKALLKVDLDKKPGKTENSKSAWSTKAFHEAQKTLFNKDMAALDKSRILLETALELDRQVDDPESEAHTLFLLAQFHIMSDSMEQALATLKKCVDMAMQIGNSELEDRARESLRAARIQKETLNLSSELDEEKRQEVDDGMQIMNNGIKALGANRLPEATVLLEDAHDIFEDLDVWLPLAQSKVLLAQALLIQNRKQEADKLADQAISLHEKHNDPENADALRKLKQQINEIKSSADSSQISLKTLEQDMENRLTQAYIDGDTEEVALLLSELTLMDISAGSLDNAVNTLTRIDEVLQDPKVEKGISARKIVGRLKEMVKKLRRTEMKIR